MKVAVLLAYAVLTTRRVTCAAIRAPLDIISLDDITETDRRHLEYLNGYYNHPPRSKRSGDDALNHLKASISQGIKSKLGLLAKGSASASGHFSKGSSGGHGYHHHDGHHDYDHHKPFDFWSLKKAILNTLLQAVKAIKGGVIAVKGQLIKGSGYLISAKGKLISSKGEAITKLGKNIATSAVLSSPHGHSEEYSHGHYHHSSPEEYGSPSAPGPEYEVPDHHYHHHPPHEDHPDANHAGILILKKIPTHDSHEHSDHLPVEHKVPDFKHIDHKEPSLGEILKKFFSASTSLKPGEPAPFGDDHHEHYHDDHQHHHDDHHHSSHEDYHHSSHEDYHDHSSQTDSHEYSSPSNNHPKATSLFEEAPPLLNVAEYASESKGAPQTHPPKTQPQSPAQSPQAPLKYDEVRPLDPQGPLKYDKVRPLGSQGPVNYDEVRPLGSQGTVKYDEVRPLGSQGTVKYDEIRPLPTSFSNVGFDTSFLSNPGPSAQSLGSFPALSAETSGLQFGAFPNGGAGSDLRFLADGGRFGGGLGAGGAGFKGGLGDAGPQVFPRENGFGNVDPSPSYPPVPYHAYLDKGQGAGPKGSLRRPTRSKSSSSRRRPLYPSPAFMKSVMYEFGRDGPKRV